MMITYTPQLQTHDQPAALGLKIDRQVFNRLLGQLFGGEFVQHGTTGGAEGVTKRRDLAVGRKGQEQKAQEVALLTRQVLRQVAAKAGQALDGRVAGVKLERTGQKAPEAEALSNQEGIGAVGLRQRPVVGPKGLNQVWIEGVDAGR